MADYWIKLYHEIIDDPKMATLPDRLWRRTIELFLLAGKLSANKSGELPDTRQLAWLLRLSLDVMQADMAELSTTGMVRATPTGWVIANFEKRQKAVDATERSKQFRERKQHEKYYGNETSLQRNVAQINRLTESDTETEQIKTLGGVDVDYGKLAIAYTENIGDITEFMAQDLQADLDQYGLAACMEALTSAIRNNVPKWSYVQGILKRKGGNGKPKAKTPKPKSHTIKQMDGTIQEVSAL